MGPRILVVDDEKFIAETLSLILQVHGYAATSALSGAQAIALASEFCPDLLLCDATMPGMNGFEAGVLIKQRCPDCHLIFFSDHPISAEFAEKSEIPRAHGYQYDVVTKPLDAPLLLDRIKALFREDAEPQALGTTP